MASTVKSPPMTEMMETNVLLACNTTIPNTAAALEPVVMPMTFGLASGLRSIVWNTVPATPNAIPANTPASMRGRRIVLTANDAPGTSAPNKTRTTSPTG